ncbi:acetyltransferase (GNAT) family protein [Knoellia remsis]|uniref:Acetyltransferase (GNAT) family protein n=1 Tax=Knoellia remsis TaxID=407159 RepID=A0A2T0UZ59_9MICO|nr:GNAT family N-acetyltransferase [Knoellia remsis]PRY63184.1 acetyltransferase (GNAT) family protein [Knoellia remsis]
MGAGSVGEARELRVVRANTVAAQDLQRVFGARGDAHRCQCQWFKLGPGESLGGLGVDELRGRLEEQARCGHARARTTSGLVAWDGDEPVGWVAVEPRTAYEGMVRSGKVPWEGRDEDRADGSVWAVTCFVTRVGHRRRGVSRALLAAAVDHARDGGARAIEGYPMASARGAIAGELFVGLEHVFADAGFEVVTRPTKRRVVMRLDLV